MWISKKCPMQKENKRKNGAAKILTFVLQSKQEVQRQHPTEEEREEENTMND